MHEFKVKYTDKIVTHAVDCFWLKTIGKMWIVAFALGEAYLAYGLAYSLLDTLAAVMFAFLSISIIGLFYIYIALRRRAKDGLNNLNKGEVAFQVSEDEIGISSKVGTSNVKWIVFDKLWKFKKVWLMFSGKGQYITFPLDQVPQEALSIIESSVKKVE